MAIEPANDPRSNTRPIPAMISPTESKNLTLPSLSEMISFPSDRQSLGNSSSTSPNKDRVPSLSQLLLPDPAPNSAMQKKRSYGQYNNLDPVSEAYVANTSVKNHARQAETPRDYEREQLWWKRADGSVCTAHGEVIR